MEKRGVKEIIFSVRTEVCSANIYTQQGILLLCNRAGIYTPKGKERRQLKTQGSNKIGEQCTAHIKVSVQLLSSQVTATYCDYHHNHRVSLSHLSIPDTIRLELAAKLQQGVSMERILDDIRDSVGDGLNREHLIRRQDLHNIRHQYNIEGVSRDQNDLTSVMAWIQELKTHKYNPVIVLKPQGQQQLPHMDNISQNDFLLGIQTEFQRDMLQKFSSTICIDSTHGTNAYEFLLLSIIVINEFEGGGIPVGWMVSNREDSLMVVEFLHAIKERCGTIRAKWFMSDDAEQFFTAWRATFGDQETKKILCAWHVDRAWRHALLEHIPNKDNQITVYHHLQVLLQETKEAQFRLRLQKFLTYIK